MCSTLERIWSDSNLCLRVTGGLTFGPKPGAIHKVQACFSQPQCNKDTYLEPNRLCLRHNIL